MVAQTFGQIFGGMFYMGTNDQIMQVGKLMVKSFKGWVKLAFPFIPFIFLGYWYIIWKVNATNRGLNLKNTFFTLCLWDWGFYVKPVFLFKKIIVVTYKALLDLHIDGPDSWRSELRHHIQNRKGLGSNQAAGDIEVK